MKVEATSDAAWDKMEGMLVPEGRPAIAYDLIGLREGSEAR